MRSQCSSVRVNNVELQVYICGDGPSVLLLHGFPDSLALWRHIAPALVKAGYRVIAPDQRGFGRSGAPLGVENYHLEVLVSDGIALLDTLGIGKAHLVGHDYGALVGWVMAGRHSGRFYSYTPLSVGHPTAYAAEGWPQKRKTWYRRFFRLRGLAEAVLMAGNWMLFRKVVRNHPETSRWVDDLSRPGRLTAAINWYRANAQILSGLSAAPRVNIPVMGIWSTADFVLTEEQMINSEGFIDNTFRYERLESCGHWIPLDAPDKTAALLLDFFAKQKTRGS